MQFVRKMGLNIRLIDDTVWWMLDSPLEIMENKKVFLRECKRHTAHRVASAHYAALSHGWVGGTMGPLPPPPPSRPDQGWGYPRYHPTIWPEMGYPPPSKPEMGYPPPSRPEMGYPLPSRPEMGYPLPRPEMGYNPLTWNGVPPYPELRWGTPTPPRPGTGYPPPPQVWTDWQYNLPSSFGCGR